jgi:hypothetical protein
MVHTMHPTAGMRNDYGGGLPGGIPSGGPSGVGAVAGRGFFNAESQRRSAAEIRNTVVAGWCIECTLRRLALGRVQDAVFLTQSRSAAEPQRYGIRWLQDGALNAPYGGWRWGGCRMVH